MDRIKSQRVTASVIQYSFIFAISIAILLRATPAYSKDESSVISLKYDWPAGITGNLRMEESVTVEDSNGKEIRSHASTGVIQTESHADGMLVTISDIEFEFHDSDPEADSEADFRTNLTKMIEVSMLENSWLIASNGEFIDVIGADDLASSIPEQISSMLGGLTEDSEEGSLNQHLEPFLNMIESFFSRELIVAAFATEWNQNVKRLDGLQLQIGTPQKIEFETPAIGNSDNIVREIGSYELIRRLPCRDGEADSQCVEITFTSEPTEESAALLDEISLDILNDMLKEVEEFKPDITEILSTFETQTSVTIVTEPSTLIPHRVITTSTNSVDMGPEHGGKQVTINEYVTQYEYQ